MSHEIWIPIWRPVTLNALLGCKLRERMRLKKQDRDFVTCYFRASEIPKATGKRRVSLELFLARGQKERDPDSMWKVLADSLVKCGALVDHTNEYVEYGYVMHHRNHKTGPQIVGTMIILDDVNG